MKKSIFAFNTIFLCCFLLSGCGFVTEDKYNKIQLEKQDLEVQITQIEEEKQDITDEKEQIESERDNLQNAYESTVSEANDKIENLNSQIEDIQGAARFWDYDNLQFKIRNMSTESDVE